MVARVFRVVALIVAAALPAFAQTDTNPPVVTFTGNQGSYELHENVVIFCNAFDAESGIASTTCQDVNTVAHLLPVGLNTLTATATDNAGNEGTGSTAFNVVVTYNGVKALTNQFVTKESSARSLSRKLDRAAQAEAAGDLVRKQRLIDSFIAQLDRETERNITAPNAALLIQFAQQL